MSDDAEQQFMAKIKTLSETIWEDRANKPAILDWLENFTGRSCEKNDEQLHVLYLLSNFMYFGSRQIRELLKAVFRDLFKYPIVESIRKSKGNTVDCELIEREFILQLMQSRFLGVGNPSESGYHLLYYFRQENELPKTNFIHTHEIFTRASRGPTLLRSTEVRKYIFIDDFCGSGQQGVDYSEDIVSHIKSLDPDTFVAYYMLFGTEKGINRIRNETTFDDVQCVYELDNTFKVFDPESRYFSENVDKINKEVAEDICSTYGLLLEPTNPLGYEDGQLMIGFHHNTPDNTLPIFWHDGRGFLWNPIFRRYPKIYGWT
ncbi:MAG: hypothetical protein ACLQVJ_29340 [Syntrophobacteraceae bacterium]